MSCPGYNQLDPITPNITKANSPFLPPLFYYKSPAEKLLKYQEKSPWAIKSVILMTSEVE